jgi:hypothetical protein
MDENDGIEDLDVAEPDAARVVGGIGTGLDSADTGDVGIGEPADAALKKLPGKRKPPTLTLKRGGV